MDRSAGKGYHLFPPGGQKAAALSEKSEKNEEKSDPVPEGAELFAKAQVASGKGATFTAKNCMIDPEVLKQLIM
jgi:hypothetical protein